MSEYELMQLVFLPGFSTAAQVTVRLRTRRRHGRQRRRTSAIIVRFLLVGTVSPTATVGASIVTASSMNSNRCI